MIERRAQSSAAQQRKRTQRVVLGASLQCSCVRCCSRLLLPCSLPPHLCSASTHSSAADAMGKRSKPLLSLAAAMHRITPTAHAPAAAAASTAAAAAAPGASAPVSVGNKKRKRGVLISAFHVLMREQDALAGQKASLGATAYAARHAELQSKLDALGGLEAYQQLSIAGHSNTKHHAFNTAHWVVDVLASYPQFANLKKYVGSHPPSGGSEASAIAAAAGAGAGATATAADEKRLAKRQKERERKRAKKRARKAAEEEEAAAAAAAAVKAAKGSKKKGATAAAAAAAAAAAKKKPQPAEDDAEDSADEDQAEEQADDHNASGSDGEEEEGDASGSSAVAAIGPVFSSTHRIRMLDVGALTNHYLPYSSEIDCTAIDLNPQHPSVRAADFFDLDPESPEYRRAFDVVVLSLVLNFVGDRFRRGEMIKRSVRMLRPEGHGRLFVILPSACLRNSRWMDHDTFVGRCMAPLGLQLMKWKYSTKLAMFEFRRVAVDPEEEAREAAERAEEEKQQAEQMDDEAAPSEQEEDDAGDADDADGSKKFARAQAKAAAKQAAQKKAAAASKKKKRKGFQPAGIVLAGETRNNFSIAWKAD